MKKWQVESELRINNQELRIQDLIKILLRNRGIKSKEEIESFLNPKLSKVTPAAVTINAQGLKKALQRIQKAIKNKEKIIVFGDYDVDGICGTAILWETLNSLGADVLPYIPSRFEEGYGLSEIGIKNLLQKGKADLIITVDNGIVANEAVDFANKNKIDVIITDHHVPAKKLPKALAIVHTTLLCGAGVAYLLAQEISKIRGPVADFPSGSAHSRLTDLRAVGSLSIGTTPQDTHLELVVLATIADLVPLTGANRILVYYGLQKLRATKRVGLLALINKAGITKEEIDTYEIGHLLAPRLNAMGRLASAMDSLRLICTSDKKKAEKLAELLNQTNLERQQFTKEALEHAKNKIEKEGLKSLIFIADKSYQQGIVGLVAGRMVEEYYLPSIIISKGEKYSKASARSIKGFNIVEFLRSASDLLVDIGGHPMAAGFTVENAKLEALEKKLYENARKLLKKEHLERILRIDCELNPALINYETYSLTQQLAPFGMANPEPTFLTKNLTITDIRVVGKDGKHLKIQFKSQNSEFRIYGIAFGMGEDSKLKIGDKVDAVYTLSDNSWGDRQNIELKIKDAQSTQSSEIL
ncbi:MAG TPA: single-stranded-DNA-specific exonuclease RecJ [Patescibacteria group bacterium]|jgi:single-stranded-DNA-specific exonuclease|nr:single-stranded-DNA-specific exonuclease RecJ [Patescibacteria group bacterium]